MVKQGMLLATGGSGFLMLVYLQLLYRYTYGKENVCVEGFFPQKMLSFCSKLNIVCNIWVWSNLE